MMEASTTRRFCTPRTAPTESTTATGSVAPPMGTVEVVEHGELAFARDLEHDTQFASATNFGCAVEVAVGSLYQAYWSATMSEVELVERG